MVKSCGNIITSTYGTIHTFRIIDDPKYSTPGDQPVPDTNIGGNDMILCKCGYMICGDTGCPFCGRRYFECDICGLWTAEEDLIDGMCDICMKDSGYYR